MTELIKKLNDQIGFASIQGGDPDLTNFPGNRGVLLTANEAKQCVAALEQRELLDKAISLLKDYEQWEADIINEDKLWQPYAAKDVMRGHIYDTMMELQEKRNQLLENLGQ